MKKSSKKRVSIVTRNTNETKINVKVELDGKGNNSISTGLPFFDHMLEQLSKHSLINIELSCIGDLKVDAHHTMEDCGLALGNAIKEALGDKKVAILQNHGILTTGPSVDIALWFYMSMERCCQAQLMAEAAGEPKIIPHDTAIKTREFIANDIAAWASYQPAFDKIIKMQPDLLD